jgi:hypothetical protein
MRMHCSNILIILMMYLKKKKKITPTYKNAITENGI